MIERRAPVGMTEKGFGDMFSFRFSILFLEQIEAWRIELKERRRCMREVKTETH